MHGGAKLTSNVQASCREGNAPFQLVQVVHVRQEVGGIGVYVFLNTPIVLPSEQSALLCRRKHVGSWATVGHCVARTHGVQEDVLTDEESSCWFGHPLGLSLGVRRRKDGTLSSKETRESHESVSARRAPNARRRLVPPKPSAHQEAALASGSNGPHPLTVPTLYSAGRSRSEQFLGAQCQVQDLAFEAPEVISSCASFQVIGGRIRNVDIR